MKYLNNTHITTAILAFLTPATCLIAMTPADQTQADLDRQLISAIHTKNTAPLIQQLLDDNANPNAVTGYGRSVLMHAARYGAVSDVQMLLEAKANPNAQDDDGYTPLHHAVSANPPSTDENRCAVISLLLGAGADTDKPDEHGVTPLMQADSSSTTKLLQAGADPNKKNNRGITPLMRAASLGSADIIDLLLSAGADIMLQNNRNENAIEYTKNQRIKIQPERQSKAIDLLEEALRTEQNRRKQEQELKTAEQYLLTKLDDQAAAAGPLAIAPLATLFVDYICADPVKTAEQERKKAVKRQHELEQDHQDRNHDRIKRHKE
jgi:hypothetical protein